MGARKGLLLLAGVGVLAGCATLPAAPSVVKEPVPTQCIKKNQLPVDPVLTISSLTASSSYATVAKAAKSSIVQLKGEVKQYKKIVKPCVETPPPATR